MERNCWHSLRRESAYRVNLLAEEDFFEPTAPFDLHARGDKVFAMLPGIVHKVGYDKRSGIFVTLRHGDITISYCHLSKVAVRKGDVVSAETIVGITGNTGRSTGEHLHITCKLKGRCVNPMVVIEQIRRLGIS